MRKRSELFTDRDEDTKIIRIVQFERTKTYEIFAVLAIPKNKWRKRKLFNNNHLNARGGLEPSFRVFFSASFMVFPWGISIRVEICGK